MPRRLLQKTVIYKYAINDKDSSDSDYEPEAKKESDDISTSEDDVSMEDETVDGDTLCSDS